MKPQLTKCCKDCIDHSIDGKDYCGFPQCTCHLPTQESKDASLKNFIIGGGLRAAEELGQKFAQINKCKHGVDAKRCWRKDCDEYIGDPPILESEIETLSAEVHQLYCAQYLKDHGKKYWTGGDYSKLEERVKEYDRNIVRWHLTHRHPRLGISHCMNLSDCPCHSLPTLESESWKEDFKGTFGNCNGYKPEHYIDYIERVLSAHRQSLENDWETVFAEFCSKDPTAGSSGWYVGPNQVKTFITNLLSSHRQSQPIEHCSEPQCPECDKAAYQRGRTDERHSLIRETKNLKRTDETQMSHDHTYDEALDDVIALLSHLDK